MKITINFVIAILGLLISAGPVMAQILHSYNGSSCSKNDDDELAPLVRSVAGIRNTASNTVTVVCPVTVDSVDNIYGTNWTEIHYTGSGFLYCALYNMDGYGSIREVRVGGRSGTGWFRLTGLRYDDWWGSYFLSCSYPSKRDVLSG